MKFTCPVEVVDEMQTESGQPLADLITARWDLRRVPSLLGIEVNIRRQTFDRLAL